MPRLCARRIGPGGGLFLPRVSEGRSFDRTGQPASCSSSVVVRVSNREAPPTNKGSALEPLRVNSPSLGPKGFLASITEALHASPLFPHYFLDLNIFQVYCFKGATDLYAART